MAIKSPTTNARRLNFCICVMWWEQCWSPAAEPVRGWKPENGGTMPLEQRLLDACSVRHSFAVSKTSRSCCRKHAVLAQGTDGRHLMLAVVAESPILDADKEWFDGMVPAVLL